MLAPTLCKMMILNFVNNCFFFFILYSESTGLWWLSGILLLCANHWRRKNLSAYCWLHRYYTEKGTKKITTNNNFTKFESTWLFQLIVLRNFFLWETVQALLEICTVHAEYLKINFIHLFLLDYTNKVILNHSYDN